MTVRDATIEADVGLDCRSAQMPVENCFRRLELDALVLAGDQFAEALDRARGQFAQPRGANARKEDREVAARNRDIVAAKMTPAQIAEAQKLAREWKPKPEW